MTHRQRKLRRSKRGAHIGSKIGLGVLLLATVPLLSIAFGGAVLAMGYVSHGVRAATNQIGLAIVTPEGDRAYAEEYVGVYGTTSADYRLAFPKNLPIRPLAEFVGFVELVIGAINKALQNIPRQQVRLHVCWGNYEGPHDCDVPLADILPVLLQANVGALVLPFANPRHAHEYRLLKSIPLAADQLIVAGVIDTQTNFVEHPQVVADRR